MKKLIFIDVDGTLCNASGLVPDTAREAIQKARANGHLVYLCTGRSTSELDDSIISIGFDGFICAGGGYIEKNGEVLFHKKFNYDEAKELIQYFAEHQIEYYLESNNGLFASENCVKQIERVACDGLEPNTKAYQARLAELDVFIGMLNENRSEIDYENINKVSFINKHYPFDKIYEKFSNDFTVIRSTVPQFGANSGEIALKGINKATAINLLLEHLDWEKEHTIAYGDAHNDIDMFKCTALSVAMGNAKSSLKEIADDVTETHDNDGIYRSFKKYRLI